MVAFNDVQAQLAKMGKSYHYLAVDDVRKMTRLLNDDDSILQCVKGKHNGRLSLLIATDKNICILSLKPNNQQVLRIQYESITDSLFDAGSFNCAVRMFTGSDVVYFSAWRSKHIKELHVFLLRHTAYLRQTATANRLTALQASPLNYKSRSWRSLVRRVGSTSIAG
jgi:Bacterial PH domain